MDWKQSACCGLFGAFFNDLLFSGEQSLFVFAKQQQRQRRTMRARRRGVGSSWLGRVSSGERLRVGVLVLFSILIFHFVASMVWRSDSFRRRSSASQYQQNEALPLHHSPSQQQRQPSNSPEPPPPPQPLPLTEEALDPPLRPIIVAYARPISSFMGNHMLGKPPGECPLECVYTEEPSRFPEADAIVHHIPQTGSSILEKAHPAQLMVSYSMEAASHYTLLQDRDFMGRFDLKMTYELDSDVICGYWSSDLAYFLRPPSPKNASALSAFICSNCNPANNRREYVAELIALQKELNFSIVNSYGACLHTTDFPENGLQRGAQKVAVMQHHPFTLAFENTNEQDYVTEKFFHALGAGSVPVYMGAPNIAQFAPSPNSYLSVDGLSPRELAFRMKILVEHPDEYQQMLAWKTEGPQQSFLDLLKRQQYDARCRLCIKIAERIR